LMKEVYGFNLHEFLMNSITLEFMKRVAKELGQSDLVDCWKRICEFVCIDGKTNSHAHEKMEEGMSLLSSIEVRDSSIRNDLHPPNYHLTKHCST
jgi:hypothetical protein